MCVCGEGGGVRVHVRSCVWGDGGGVKGACEDVYSEKYKEDDYFEHLYHTGHYPYS